MTTKSVFALLSNAIINQTSAVFPTLDGGRTIQATITGTDTVACTITWFGNNNKLNSGGVLLATSTLSGTNTDNTGANITAEWPYVYCVLAGISGTDAAVTATMGV